MVSSFRRRERGARRGFGALLIEALICAVVAAGCSSTTIHTDGAGGSKHTASGGESSDDPAGSAGGKSAAENGGSGNPGSGGSQGGNFGSGGRERASGGDVGTGGLARANGGNLGAGGSRQDAGSGGAGIAPGGAGTPGDILPKILPDIPPVTADCPKFVSGVISFMGLDGIQLDVGTPPPEATAPMLFYWHGTASTSGEYKMMAEPVASAILAAKGVIVSFQGTTGGDLYSFSSIFGAGDLVLADQLVACAVRNANVDPRRIYTMGCSAGGFISTAKAALRSSYNAAAAPNSGGVTVAPPFQNARTPALMTVHEAPGSSAGIIDFVAASADADKLFKARGGFVIDCNTGGGHCGGSVLAPDVWQFFLAHPYAVDPEPWTPALPSTFSTLCKIQ